MTDPVAPVPPAAPVYAPAPQTNTLAIVGFILAFLVSVAGIIVSAIALGQIKRTGEGGHGLAVGGIIVGIIVTVLYVLIFASLVIFPLMLVGSACSTGLCTTY